MNSPVDFPAVFLLALASGAIGASRRLAIKSSWEEFPSVFVCVVGDPGSSKTPVMGLLARPLYEAQERLFAEHRDRMEEWEAREASVRGERPKPGRCVVSDITVESLGCILADNPRGVCIVRDELSALMLGMNQYKGGKGNDRQFFLSLWSSSPITIDRKGDTLRTGAPTHIASPFASIVGGIQPGIVDQLRGAGGDDGFADRWLFSFPDPLPAVGETWDEVPASATQEWDGVVAKLLAATTETDSLRPDVIELTDDGRRQWQSFTDSHAAEMNADDFPAFLRGPWVKLKSYTARLALVIQLLRWASCEAGNGAVDGESLKRAWKLTDYFKGMLRKVRRAIDADPKTVMLGRLVAWIKRSGRATFSTRDIRQDLRRSIDAESMRRVIDLAVSRGLIRRSAEAGSSRPGPKSERFDVNPAL